MLYSYLNLESTKTDLENVNNSVVLYSYLNLESTKTAAIHGIWIKKLYSYLNLESTKTSNSSIWILFPQNHYKFLNPTRQYYSSKYFNNIGLIDSIRNFVFILYWYKLFKIFNTTWSSTDKLMWRMSELNK